MSKGKVRRSKGCLKVNVSVTSMDTWRMRCDATAGECALAYWRVVVYFDAPFMTSPGRDDAGSQSWGR